MDEGRPVVVDTAQLTRIEAVHRGFLFQHLYAARSLLLTPGTDVLAVIVESDEDVEIVRANGRTYVQVKFRAGPLGNTDIEAALERFDTYRRLHQSGARPEEAVFVIATNAPLTPSLANRVADPSWPRDVRIDYPGSAASGDPVTPISPASLADAFNVCRELAARLPYALLSPETLVWKLAGAVMAAASGAAPRADHAFRPDELTGLFEQIVVQLQDFPAPPSVYRAQADEPTLLADAPLRLIAGYSGAGKTAWVSQAALHTVGDLAYYDLREVPGPSLASGLARDLAARIYGASGGRLGEVLLPGASGLEILKGLARRLVSEGRKLTVVLDNAHDPQPVDVEAAVRAASGLNFVLLCQPGAHQLELARRLGVEPETLHGWSPDAIAAEAASMNCRANLADCQALLALTGGLPLYVQNALAVARSELGGDVAALCAQFSALTHSVETVQELILSRTVDALSGPARHALGVLSLSDVPLSHDEIVGVVTASLGIDVRAVAGLLRGLRTAAVLEVFGGDHLKIHDAFRLLGRAQLASLGADSEAAAYRSLRDVLRRSLKADWSYPKLKLLLRVLAETEDIKTLVQLGTDELFHEMGLWPEIEAHLHAAAGSDSVDPESRFWALDGIVFNALREGGDVRPHIERMKRLVADHALGQDERLAVSLKEMMLLAREGRADAAMRVKTEAQAALKATPAYQRIFRYNAAVALHHLGDHDKAASEALAVAQEYYDLLGLTPQVVLGRNASELRPLLKRSDDVVDHCKHLADCLDLCAKAVNADGADVAFARIHAMKFYELAQAPESLIRVGQDVVDEFIGRCDYVGARQVFETNILPNLQRLKLAAYVIPVRSQYAVTLAYCGDFRGAEAEMARLAPYEAGLSANGRLELQRQRQLIAKLRRDPPPPQWLPPPGFPLPDAEPRHAERLRKLGRNELCFCGSGKKYKKCHG
ncbi:SEC-C domain-containing protein [Hyalangium gracile]|uniref:SEC-C domain-containing protein n=1 Tax=Hyalangium gracile TaxID=394092 RepID=UPI001CCAE92E|nr:SEC-C domain-containing protein [Hyalangium gracile]